MQKIYPCLWFNHNAEEAIKHYKSIFKKFKVIRKQNYPKDFPGPEGKLMVAYVSFEGQQFMFLNGGPHFAFSEAISFVINCKTQKEIDYYWDKLCEGGEESQCGWLKDKFGVSWQVYPQVMDKLVRDKDKKKANRVWQAMLTMKKMDITALKKAHKGV